MVRVLITGASGFIGSNLARACLSRGDEVSVIARPHSSLDRLAGIESRIGINRLDIADVASLGNCLDAVRPEIVFHVGARTRFEDREDLQDLAQSTDENITPLIALLSAAASSEHPPRTFVRTGTIAEYGNIATPYAEAARENPRGAYGASLLAGTHYLAMAQPRLPFRAVTARLALTYGPGQSHSFLIPHMIATLLDGLPVDVRRPRDRRDLIHVDDVTRALMMIGDTPEAVGSLVNVGTGHAPSVAEVTLMLIELTGAAAGLAKFSNATHEPVELNTSIEHIRSGLGWSPEIQLHDGLERTVRWAQENRDHKVAQFAKAVQA